MISFAADRQGSSQGRISQAQMGPTSLGHGQDYFESMFNDLKRVDRLHSPKVSVQNRPKSSPCPQERYATPVTHDYTTATSR